MGLQSKNQDAFVVESTLLDLNHCHMYAVIDGHGLAGYETANKIEKRLPFHMKEELRQALIIVENPLNLAKQYPKDKVIEKAIRSAFEKAESDLLDML